jgi:hypothetical protein
VLDGTLSAIFSSKSFLVSNFGGSNWETLITIGSTVFMKTDFVGLSWAPRESISASGRECNNGRKLLFLKIPKDLLFKGVPIRVPLFDEIPDYLFLRPFGSLATCSGPDTFLVPNLSPSLP